MTNYDNVMEVLMLFQKKKSQEPIFLISTKRNMVIDNHLPQMLLLALKKSPIPLDLLHLDQSIMTEDLCLHLNHFQNCFPGLEPLL